jgi:hypothetical protein
MIIELAKRSNEFGCQVSSKRVKLFWPIELVHVRAVYRILQRVVAYFDRSDLILDLHHYVIVLCRHLQFVSIPNRFQNDITIQSNKRESDGQERMQLLHDSRM